MAEPHDQNELVAVVNAQDEVIDESRRSELDARLHREASVFVVNGKGEVLIQKRRDSGKLDFSASGHFPANETYLQGAVRELMEELCLSVNPGDLLEVQKERVDAKTADHVNNRFITLFELRGGFKETDFIVDSKEVEWVRFYSPKELSKMLEEQPEAFSTGCRVLLPRYLKRA